MTRNWRDVASQMTNKGVLKAKHLLMLQCIAGLAGCSTTPKPVAAVVISPPALPQVGVSREVAVFIPPDTNPPPIINHGVGATFPAQQAANGFFECSTDLVTWIQFTNWPYITTVDTEVDAYISTNSPQLYFRAGITPAVTQ